MYLLGGCTCKYILGVDTSDLRFGGVKKLVLELETRDRTELFRIHSLSLSVNLRTMSNQFGFVNYHSSTLNECYFSRGHATTVPETQRISCLSMSGLFSRRLDLLLLV